MTEAPRTPEGTPTVYLDASAAIEYFIVEGVEAYTSEPRPEPSAFEGPEHLAIRELLNSDARSSAMVRCRRAYLAARDPGALLVTSPLAVIELSEWYAETVFRSACVEVAGPGAIQRRGKKDVGDLLAKLMGQVERDAAGGSTADSGVEARRVAFRSMFVAPSFLDSHGLRGVDVRDLDALSVTSGFAYGVGQVLGYLQLGLADVLHVIAARHLGCAYFASFDSDFRRVKAMLADDFGLTLISSPEGLRSVIVDRKG